MNNYARCEQALSQINSRRIIFTIMRTFLLFIAIGITTLQANDSYAQTRLDIDVEKVTLKTLLNDCLLYTSPSPRDLSTSRMPSSA